MSAGEIFDNVAGIGMEALGGKLAKAKTGTHTEVRVEIKQGRRVHGLQTNHYPFFSN